MIKFKLRYSIVLLSVRLLHLAKRFGPKRAFFSCKMGYKTYHDMFYTPLLYPAETFC